MPSSAETSLTKAPEQQTVWNRITTDIVELKQSSTQLFGTLQAEETASAFSRIGEFVNGVMTNLQQLAAHSNALFSTIAKGILNVYNAGQSLFYSIKEAFYGPESVGQPALEAAPEVASNPGSNALQDEALSKANELRLLAEENVQLEAEDNRDEVAATSPSNDAVAETPATSTGGPSDASAEVQTGPEEPVLGQPAAEQPDNAAAELAESTPAPAAEQAVPQDSEAVQAISAAPVSTAPVSTAPVSTAPAVGEPVANELIAAETAGGTPSVQEAAAEALNRNEIIDTTPLSAAGSVNVTPQVPAQAVPVQQAASQPVGSELHNDDLLNQIADLAYFIS